MSFEAGHALDTGIQKGKGSRLLVFFTNTDVIWVV